jgi:hypothetical protein
MALNFCKYLPSLYSKQHRGPKNKANYLQTYLIIKYQTMMHFNVKLEKISHI